MCHPAGSSARNARAVLRSPAAPRRQFSMCTGGASQTRISAPTIAPKRNPSAQSRLEVPHTVSASSETASGAAATRKAGRMTWRRQRPRASANRAKAEAPAVDPVRDAMATSSARDSADLPRRVRPLTTTAGWCIAWRLSGKTGRNAPRAARWDRTASAALVSGRCPTSRLLRPRSTYWRPTAHRCTGRLSGFPDSLDEKRR